jgi:proline iminopeptidase
VSTAPGHSPAPRYEDPRFRMRFARLVTRYWANAAFVADCALLRDAVELNGVPGVLINGRMDISGPSDTAWNLAQVWKDAELVIVENEGRGASGNRTVDAILAATDRFRP